MTTKISILIADDHPIFRKGLRQIIEADADLDIVAEVSDGEAAWKVLQELRPAVAVLDVDMPKRDGFELARWIREENLPTAVIVLTMYKEERFFNAALDAGVVGYVIKDSAITEITDAVRAAAAGKNFISPALSTLLMNRLNRAQGSGPKLPADALTASERRVLKLVGEYKTNKQIADELFVSVRTIEAHRAHICNKLEIAGSHALLQFALKHRDEL